MVKYYEGANKIVITDITGIDSAYRSLLQSYNSWTPELEYKIQSSWIKYYTTGECDDFMNSMCEKIVKYGAGLGSDKCHITDGHETLLRFIDIHMHVIELHRGAMDDFDSHAMNMNNRIVRRSTRLMKNDGDNVKNKSDWYEGKIVNAKDIEGLLPETMNIDDKTWVLGRLGNYIREDLIDDNDCQRGNYPLSIPSGCMCVVNLHSLRHIYKRRNVNTHAAPELREMMEEMADKLEELLPAALAPCIRNDWVLIQHEYGELKPGWGHISEIQKVVFKQ